MSKVIDGCKVSSLLFSEESPVVICGASDGSVQVFRCAGSLSGDPDLAPDEQAKRLDDVTATASLR